MNNPSTHLSLEQALSLASQAQREGRNKQAEKIYRQVIDQLPRDFPDQHVYHMNLGVAVARQGRSDEALPCFHRAIELRPDYAEAHANLAFALKSNGQFAEALQGFQDALLLEPEDPNTLFNLGILHAERGDAKASITCLRDAIRHDPTMADAWLRLVTIQDGVISDDDSAAIRQLLSRDNLSAEQQASLHAALARVHDSRGEFDHAAQHADLANANQLSHLQRSARQYNPDASAQFVSRIIATFDAELLERYRALGSDSRVPVFIFGMPRSGKTLVEKILASHPLVYGADELAYVFDSFRSLPSVIGISQPPMECVPQLSSDHIREVAAVHLERLRKIDVDAKRVTNTLPDNYLLLGFIRMLFPNATLIHCRRDLRDVAVSCWIKHFHNVPWSHDQTHIASRINEYQRVINHWNDLLAGEILEVNYEDLVQNPEAVSQQLIDLCGLDWDSSCLADNHRQREMQACDETQARQVLTTRSIARFSSYESHLADLFAAIDQ